MADGSLAFECFVLDHGNRQLTRDGIPVGLNNRYLDALALLVRHRGRVVSKEQFLEEVWHGVPVTDEAITQCIRTLRSRLGDQASSPRFIETVPKHGYRFIAAVTQAGDKIAAVTRAGTEPAPQPASMRQPVASSPTGKPRRQFLMLGVGAMVGGGIAGGIGGVLYGFAAASQSLQSGAGAISVLLVLACITILVSLIGGAGVGVGIASAGFLKGNAWQWSTLGGAAGGLLIGAVVKLLGADAINLLFGRSPGDITGAAEGMLLGAAVGLGAWFASRGAGSPSVARGVAGAAATGAGAGVLIALLGGRLMVGSLDSLARQFPGSRLRLDPIGGLFGEAGFGPISQVVTACLEGALFSACIVGAMMVVRRANAEPNHRP